MFTLSLVSSLDSVVSPDLANGNTRNARKTLVALAALVLFSGTAFARDRPLSFGLQGNWRSEATVGAKAGLGARLVGNLDRYVANTEIVGSVDYYFPSHTNDLDLLGPIFDLTELNVNAVYKFTLNSTAVRPYVGAGLNIASVKGSPGSDLSDGVVVHASVVSTRTGVNFLGGALFGTENQKFFLEAKGEWKGGGTVVVSGGVRF